MFPRFHLATLAAAAALAAPIGAAAQEAVGAWHGVLVAGPNILRVVVRVKATAYGKLEGELVSPDQSPRGFPLGEVKLSGNTFSFAVPVIQAGGAGAASAAAPR